MPGSRKSRDFLGEVEIPAGALYGAGTGRAVENFPVSGRRLPPLFISALARIKWHAAATNVELGVLDAPCGEAIVAAAREIIDGRHEEQFPVDVFQTGSGTSTHMNVNEVIANLASRRLGSAVHPNDHVNLGQSSNDVIPTAIHLSAYGSTVERLIPALDHLAGTIDARAGAFTHVVKTGRTHLMDAVPIRFDQEMSGWSHQMRTGAERLRGVLPRVAELAQGGTAVGTGLNAHPDFAARFTARLAADTGYPFVPAANRFAAIATQDTAVELSGQARTVAVGLLKIANDLRWLGSGPRAGLGEIALPEVQPGSSLMPGKINPVIPEAVAMVCVQAMGNDATVAIAGQSGQFQLNTMLPLIACTLLETLENLAAAARLLADKAVRGLAVDEERIATMLKDNAMLVTALAPRIGYARCAEIARRAGAEGRSIRDVAEELTDVPGADLDRLLDPRRLTGP